MPAVVFPAPNGAPVDALAELIDQLVAVADVKGFEVCGYDPTRDERRKLPAVIAGMFGAYARTAVAS
jgi:arginase family enzyme